MADKLLPCPFCGSEAKYHGSSYTEEICEYVSCRKCNAQSPLMYRKGEAVEWWNRRPSPWHTGTPTEDGEYLVICQYVINNYYYREKLVWEFENGDWKNKQRLTENNYIEELKILAWYGHKIEPYKEK